MAGKEESPKESASALDGAKVRTTSDKKLQVEFSISELVKKLAPSIGKDLASCGGCNGCMGCSHIVD